MTLYAKAAVEGRLRLLFHLFDSDGDVHLGEDELRVLLRACAWAERCVHGRTAAGDADAAAAMMDKDAARAATAVVEACRARGSPGGQATMLGWLSWAVTAPVAEVGAYFGVLRCQQWR